MQDPVIGRVIGNYRVLGPLGEGGMAKVYRAEHSTIGKEAALKLLNPEYSRKEQSVARFFHEAQAVNRIRHENLVDVFDFGKTPEGDHYILMELLHGEPLTDSISSKKPLSVDRILHIGIQICYALEATHQKGIVHRDLKDANVFLTTRAGQKDFVKILDFGIAKLLDGSSPDIAKTKSGAMIGTPLYISPEQARGSAVGPASDIYAFGCLMFVMATGSPPFMDENAVAVALKHIDEPPPHPREKNPNLPEKLEAIILRCLEKSPEARYPSMLAVAKELEALAKGNTTLEITSKIPRRAANHAQRNVVIGGAAAGLLLTVGGYFLFAGASPKKELLGSNPGLTSFVVEEQPAASVPTSIATTQKIIEAPVSQPVAEKDPPKKGKTPPEKNKDNTKTADASKTTPEKTEPAETPKTTEKKTDTKAGGWTVNPFTGEKVQQ
jgi:serine/threonine protein kinase